jgi:multisubunit Na+/H+ antiporter MnhB subunit
MARSQMATMAMAMMLYPIFFSRPNRMNLFVLAGPLGLMLLIAVSDVLIDNFMNAEGAEVRAAAYKVAWENALELPVFGYGQSSGYSKTYQDIFGPKFFPDDLGLIGMTFKYGFIGLAMYIFFNFYVVARLLKANWYYRKHYGAHNPVLWSLFLLMTALSMNLILNPGLAYMQGLTTASFSIAITACYYEEFGLRPGKSRH